MKKNANLAFLAALGFALTLGACNKSDSPTAPRPSPTPSAATLTLSVSPTSAVTEQPVDARATVRQGIAPVPDGTPVTFALPERRCGSSLCYWFIENNEFTISKTTQGGVASAAWTSRESGDVTVSARSGSATASVTVRFSYPQQQAQPPSAPPRFYGITPSLGSARGGYNATVTGQWLCKFYLNGSCHTPADVTMRQVFKVVDQVLVQPDGTVVVTYKDVNRDVALRVVAFSGTGDSDSLTVAIPEADTSLLREDAKVNLVFNNGVQPPTEVVDAFEYAA
ncbi:MAG: hypothetical protein ACP5NF_09335, partial [Thermoanaerobaculum sp.]